MAVGKWKVFSQMIETVDEAFRIRDKFFPKLGLEYLFQNDA